MVRAQGEFAKEEAVIVMDNCQAQLTQEVLGIFTAAHVRVITFGPPTTSFFPILDLTLFGALKQRRQYQLPFKTENAISAFITNGCRDFRATMIDINIFAAF
jgi:hypothetical protein